MPPNSVRQSQLAAVGIENFRHETDRQELPTPRRQRDFFGGIEADADDQRLSFTAAVERVRHANIRALLYTSPSWVEGVKEKWWVLFPLSQTYPPDQRAEFVAWGNGLLFGSFSPETFTFVRPTILAMSAGSTIGLNRRRRFLDQRRDLIAHAISKPTSKTKDSPGPGNANGTNPGWQHHIEANLSGSPLPTSVRDLAAKWIASGMSGGAAVNSLRALMECITSEDRRSRTLAKSVRQYSRVGDQRRGAGVLTEARPMPQPTTSRA